MPRISNKLYDELPFSRSMQITDVHCGPAVIQMLLSGIGVYASQEQIATAGGVTHEMLKGYGMRLDQMAGAVKRLVPQARFWYKEHARIRDIKRILDEYHLPVAVEWQGLFEAESSTWEGLSDEEGDDDPGHYSIITRIDEERHELIIVDPYREFALQDRIFDINEFVERWWDTNAVTDPVTGREHFVEDRRMLFFVAPREEWFAPDLHLRSDISHLIARYQTPRNNM
jgi:hypothetical protein